jgi:acyl homoserine lactone synthase
MRAVAIEPGTYDNFAVLRDSMHRLRARVFQDRLNWDVAIVDGCEADSFERILRRAGWPMTRIGEPRPIGNTLAVAGLLPADEVSFDRVRPADYSSSIRALARAA